MNKDFYKIINVYKGLAIISVIFAHCVYQNTFLQSITSIIGKIGVPAFLIIGGILLNPKKRFFDFLDSKIKRIIVPWIVYGVLTYILSVVLIGSNLNFMNMFKWIIGYKTWLYYVPIYIFCMFISYFLYEKKGFIITSILITIISILLTNFELLPYRLITPYQNPLNWLGFYTLGIYIRRNQLTQEFRVTHNMVLINTFLFIIFIVLQVFLKMSFSIELSYWNIISIAFELYSIYYLFIISYLFRKNKFLNYAGLNSYAIYFLHMQIGINFFELTIEKVFNIDYILLFIKPVFTIAFLCLGIQISYYILTKMKLQKLNILFSFMKA